MPIGTICHDTLSFQLNEFHHQGTFSSYRLFYNLQMCATWFYSNDHKPNGLRRVQEYVATNHLAELQPRGCVATSLQVSSRPIRLLSSLSTELLCPNTMIDIDVRYHVLIHKYLEPPAKSAQPRRGPALQMAR